MEKLSSMKLVPGAIKAGDHWCKGYAGNAKRFQFHFKNRWPGEHHAVIFMLKIPFWLPSEEQFFRGHEWLGGNELGDCWWYLAIGDGGLDEVDNYGVGGKWLDFMGESGYKVSEEFGRIKNNSKVWGLNSWVNSDDIGQDREDSEKSNYRVYGLEFWSPHLYWQVEMSGRQLKIWVCSSEERERAEI